MTQILNGLLVPTTGNMYFEGLDTKGKISIKGTTPESRARISIP